MGVKRDRSGNEPNSTQWSEASIVGATCQGLDRVVSGNGADRDAPVIGLRGLGDTGWGLGKTMQGASR